MKTIVIVDDDLDVLEGMRDAVPWNQLNIQWVGEAIDGLKGVQLIRELQSDIVITDIKMPIMNGLEMIEILRKEGYKGKFILLTGYADFEYARQAIRLNVDDYLSKPITLESLGKVLSGVVERLEHDEASRLEYITLKEKVNKYKPYFMNEWLKSVILNKAEDISEEISEVKDIVSNWSRQHHCILGIEILEEHVWKSLEANRNLLQFAIQNITCEMVKNGFPDFDYLVIHSHRIAVLIHMDPSILYPEDVQDKLSDIQRNLYAYLAERLKININVATSAILIDWRMIGQAYCSLFNTCDAEDKECAPFLQKGENRRHHQIVSCIVQFIHDHYAENITLGPLSDELQISKNYLGQIFRNITGDTFNQYVTKVRMEKAKQLILDSRYYIYEIAEMVGYNNIPYFSNQFKKYIGLNPTELLKQ